MSTLKMKEPRALAVALEGLENVLKAGQEHFTKAGVENKFALVLENEGGLDLIEELQLHPNHQIYNRSLRILEEFFTPEEDQVLSAAPTAGNTTEGGHFNF